MHRDRRAHLASRAALIETGDWEGLYRLTMLVEAPAPARFGFQLAFLRPFAVPRMADVLVAAGGMSANPMRRTYDTGLLIYELIAAGLDSPTGRAVVSAINRAHRHRSINEEDMTAVLCAFIVTPLRHLVRASWRTPTTTTGTPPWSSISALAS